LPCWNEKDHLSTSSWGSSWYAEKEKEECNLKAVEGGDYSNIFWCKDGSNNCKLTLNIMGNNTGDPSNKAQLLFRFYVLRGN